jgi:hypothetical protein
VRSPRCAKHPTNSYCGDGGEDWGTPPIGTAANPESTQWTPHSNVPVYDGATATATTYSCQVMDTHMHTHTQAKLHLAFCLRKGLIMRQSQLVMQVCKALSIGLFCPTNRALLNYE